ncbi:MAG TPA: DUF2330 domain-containing protein [Actinomycetota bacterium]
MTRRLLSIVVLMMALLVLGAGSALACGGLVAPGHAEVLRKATTLSAWHAGYEHYVTGFRFAGDADGFGYIIPLPGVPAKIEKGGGWTLERLEREINPVAFGLPAALGASAERGVVVLQQVRVDALDITVVRGGGPDVAAWAQKNGFDLTPDTGQVLGHYSDAGAVFALAKFDALESARRGIIEGQGTTIHFTIPAAAPWIPLRILALGKGGPEVVDADLFVLTDQEPSLTPALWDMPGMTLKAYGPATDSLLQDLRSDKGMNWLPSQGMWFTAISLHTAAKNVTYDLSIDGGGPPPVPGPVASSVWTWWAVASIAVLALVAAVTMWRPAPPRLGTA